MEEIVKVQRNYDGEIINFQTNSGRIISYQKALLEVEEGIIQGVSIVENNFGDSELTSNIVEDPNFSSYPTIF
jgi:hypothetical protein